MSLVHPQVLLTPREQEVLDLVRAQRTNKQIAKLLGIADGTVKIHLKHVFGKLGVTNRYALMPDGKRPIALETELANLLEGAVASIHAHGDSLCWGNRERALAAIERARK